MKTTQTTEGRELTLYTKDDVISACPMCGAQAIVELSPALKAKQPDDTTHVCHPGFGGCNHGFAMDNTEGK